ncbi:hypothetical protein ACFX1T_008234 [Malus domestica]
MAMRLAAAAHPVRSGLNEAVKGVVKGDVCSFKTNACLDYLLAESQTHLLEMKYITEMIERVAKYFGCPPPPRPPTSLSKEEAKCNGGGAKVNGGGTNDDGAKGNGGGDGGIPRNLLESEQKCLLIHRNHNQNKELDLNGKAENEWSDELPLNPENNICDTGVMNRGI